MVNGASVSVNNTLSESALGSYYAFIKYGVFFGTLYFFYYFFMNAFKNPKRNCKSKH